MNKKFENYVLEDDKYSTGGVSFVGETLGNFCAEAEIDLEKISLEELNNELISCGIKPVASKVIIVSDIK